MILYKEERGTIIKTYCLSKSKKYYKINMNGLMAVIQILFIIIDQYTQVSFVCVYLLTKVLLLTLQFFLLYLFIRSSKQTIFSKEINVTQKATFLLY